MMRITIAKGSVEDHIGVRRADGSRIETRLAHKGPVPHDAVHLFVEQALGLSRGFWGLVAAGHHPAELVELAKAAGHASAARAQQPEPTIVELLQAERLVECYEALLWGGGGTREDVLAMADVACATSFVPCPALPEDTHKAIVAALDSFAQAWVAAPKGHVVELAWS
ncbi:hypothetical protein [Novosphingobium percolationis]|uniref:hypothetical protein n=1 Tax=Novosphingobium percolationis TaxID=2871811 RepID=UPI001CD497A4|nr:hypothetical protein [Novosphingobium percolationis]